MARTAARLVGRKRIRVCWIALGSLALTIAGGVTLTAAPPPPLAPGRWWTGDAPSCGGLVPCEWTEPQNWEWINSPLFPPISYPSNSSEDVWISLNLEKTIELAPVTVNQLEISLEDVDFHMTNGMGGPLSLSCDHLKIKSLGDPQPLIVPPVTITISDGATLATVN